MWLSEVCALPEVLLVHVLSLDWNSHYRTAYATFWGVVLAPQTFL